MQMTAPTSILIPDTGTDLKVGDVLAVAFMIINESECSCSRVVWDYAEAESLHPFLISILGIYKEGRSELITEVNISDRLNARLASCSYRNPVDLSEKAEPVSSSDIAGSPEFLPICKFRRSSDKVDRIESLLSSRIRKMVADRTGHNNLASAISYILAELTCNIQEHSEASHGYIFAACPGGDSHLYLCIADNGRTIHGCYTATAKSEYLRVIGEDHAEAIRYSTKGISTKNRPNNESRGYGISTNLDMVINGLGGSFVILSGAALFRGDRTGEQFVSLPMNINWDGTIILVKIPLKQKEDFDVYKYIE